MRDRLITLFLVNGRLCLIEIFSNKMRSFISAFGIFLGVASLLVLLSFMRGLNKGVMESIVNMGGLDIISISKLEPQTKEDELSFRKSPGLLLNQAERLKSEIPDIELLMPEYTHGRVEISAAGKNEHGMAVAVSPYHFSQFNYELSSGREFTAEDFERASRVCVIGRRVAEEIFPDVPDPVGRSLNFMNTRFQVIGLLYTENRWDRRSRSLLYPFATYVRDLGGGSGKISNVKLKVRGLENLQAVKERIREKLMVMHRGVEDFDVVLNDDKIKDMEDTGRAIRILIIVVAALSLITGGVSIMNIMFATIGDRIREIGVRKALGAHRSDLFTQFLIEAVLLCFVGGLPGLFFGSIPSLLPKEWFPMEPNLVALDYFLCVLFILLVGLFAGLFPALKAARMRPIEALQYG